MRACLLLLALFLALASTVLGSCESAGEKEAKRLARETINSALQSLAENPDDAKTHYVLGLAYFTLKKYEEALPAFEKCEELLEAERSAMKENNGGKIPLTPSYSLVTVRRNAASNCISRCNLTIISPEVFRKQNKDEPLPEWPE